MSTLGRDEILDQDAFTSDPDDHDYNEHNVEDQVSEEDDEMWAEGFEGPNDDDVFADRPTDHAVQELRKYKAIMRAERRKMMSNIRKGRVEVNVTPTSNQGARTLNDLGSSTQTFWMSNRGEGGWYSESESASDEDLDKNMISDSEKEEDAEMYKVSLRLGMERYEGSICPNIEGY